MHLGMLRILSRILVISLYLWAHRTIVFVIQSLLQAVEICILATHWRNLRSILLVAGALDDGISSCIGNSILCSLLLRALTQSRPRGEVLNLNHLLLLILFVVVLVILGHGLMGAQILGILQGTRWCCCALVCGDVLAGIRRTCRADFFDVLGNISAVHAASAAYAANATIDMGWLQPSFVITFILSIINLSCVLLIR